MPRLLLGSINLSKIDKSKVITKNKFGEPFKDNAKYLEIAVWVEDHNQVNQYGQIASISTGKAEERIYLGNLKEFEQATPADATATNSTDVIATPALPSLPTIGPDDDLPF